MMNEVKNNIGLLLDRQLIEVRGVDAAAFLQGLITTHIDDLVPNTMNAGALLSPQGKVLFDFLIGYTLDEKNEEARYFIDAPASIADTFAKRLSLYKLRSAIDIIMHQPIEIDIIKGQMEAQTDLSFLDNRFTPEDPIMRLYRPLTKYAEERQVTQTQEWNQTRIDNAIAESGVDFMLGDVFAHDINLDQIGGLSFSKGCYIGQEIVSRMHHRGTARRRLLLVQAQTTLPERGTALEADTKPLGQMGSSVSAHGVNKGLAIVRLDRVKHALDKGQVIKAGGIEVQLKIPARAQFSYPSTSHENV